MRALCVVLVVLLASKAGNALAAGRDGLQQPPVEETFGSVDSAQGGGGDSENSPFQEQDRKDEHQLEASIYTYDVDYGDESLLENFEFNPEDVPGQVCEDFKGLTDEVATVIRREIEDGTVKAKLDDNDRCTNIKKAVKLLEEMTSPIWSSHLYYAEYKLKGETSDAKIAELLWSKGVMSGVLSVAVEQDVELRYGCAKNHEKALCMFAPSEQYLKTFAEEAELREEKLEEEIDKIEYMDGIL
ncbi:unnamed protein product [Cylicocyclus nassatus]|uniref:Uncharacterized protein n=1 Tax=Cylicocyclus nassatus TaxID=53992 RepID=A0AA36DR50_CYLNA|nr:unnamed protein product [Cylicocyclus nassatus]